MSRKIEQLSIDGVNVDMSKARFADTFEVTQSDERYLAYDEEVVWVVVARVSAPSFRETKGGDLNRVNVIKVKEARLLRDVNLQASVLDKMNFDFRPQKSLFEVPTKEESEPTVEELGVRIPVIPFSADELEDLDQELDDHLNMSGIDLDDLDADLAVVGAIAEGIGTHTLPEDDVIITDDGRRRMPLTSDDDPVLKRFLGV